MRDLPTRCGSFPRGLLLPPRTLLSPAPPPPFFTPPLFFPRTWFLVPRWGPSSRLEQILPAWSKQQRGPASDLEGLVRNDGEKAATDLEAARDVNSATCDFVDYWRATELWRTATSWTSGPGVRDSEKRR